MNEIGRQRGPLRTPSDLGLEASRDISAGLNVLLADLFALFLKTKNFHWHVSGPHFRDYHLLFDEQASQVLATTDAVAERVRKIGGTTLHSIGHVSRLQRLTACWSSCATTICSLRPICAKRTAFAKSMAMWPARVQSRSGSTRRSAGSGSCSRRVVAARIPRNRYPIEPDAPVGRRSGRKRSRSTTRTAMPTLMWRAMAGVCAAYSRADDPLSVLSLR